MMISHLGPCLIATSKTIPLLPCSMFDAKLRSSSRKLTSSMKQKSIVQVEQEQDEWEENEKITWVLRPRHVKKAKPKITWKNLTAGATGRPLVQALAKVLYEFIVTEGLRGDEKTVKRLITDMGMDPASNGLHQVWVLMNTKNDGIMHPPLDLPLTSWTTQRVLYLIGELSNLPLSLRNDLKSIGTTLDEFTQQHEVICEPGHSTQSFIAGLEKMVNHIHLIKKRDLRHQAWDMLLLDEIAWRRCLLVVRERHEGEKHNRTKTTAVIRKLAARNGRPLSHIAKPLLDFLEPLRGGYCEEEDWERFQNLFGPETELLWNFSSFSRTGCFHPSLNQATAWDHLCTHPDPVPGLFVTYFQGKNSLGVTWLDPDLEPITGSFTVNDCYVSFSHSTNIAATLTECLDSNKAMLSCPYGLPYKSVPWLEEGLGDGMHPFQRAALLGRHAVLQNLLRKPVLKPAYRARCEAGRQSFSSALSKQREVITVDSPTEDPEVMFSQLSRIEVKKIVSEAGGERYKNTFILETMWKLCGAKFMDICTSPGGFAEWSHDHRLEGLSEEVLKLKENHDKKRKGKGYRALHCALLHRGTDPYPIVSLLLARSADPNLLDALGYPPLHYSIVNLHVSCTKLLLQQGSLPCFTHLRSPLHLVLATPSPPPDLVEFLAEASPAGKDLSNAVHLCNKQIKILKESNRDEALFKELKLIIQRVKHTHTCE